MAVDPFTWLVHGAASSLSLALTKNIFTTVFFLLSFLIASFGSRWIIRRAHRRILRREAVSVNSMVPWLSTTSAIQYIWHMRRLPAGSFGLLMLVSGGFSSILSPYIINSYVVQIETIGLCQFASGIVTTMFQGGDPYPVIPSADWPASKMAVGAQNVAIAAGLKPAIYSKIDNNYTNFYPRQEDTLGFWDCKQEGYTVIEPADWTNNITIQDWSGKQRFLYPNFTWNFGDMNSNGEWNAVVALGVDRPEYSIEPWDLTAIISSKLNGTVPINASNLRCKLNITEPSWTPAPLRPYSTFDNWGNSIVGLMLDVEPDLYQQQLEVALNAMSILGSTGNNHAWNVSTANSTGAGTDFQCLKPVNHIKGPIFIVLFILTVILVFLIIPDLYDLIRSWLSKSYGLDKRLPFQLLDWQLEMVQRSTGDKSITRRQLNELEYVWDPSTSTYLCRRRVSQNNKNQRLSHAYEAVKHPFETNSGVKMQVFDTESTIPLTNIHDPDGAPHGTPTNQDRWV